MKAQKTLIEEAAGPFFFLFLFWGGLFLFLVLFKFN